MSGKDGIQRGKGPGMVFGVCQAISFLAVFPG
jgi:hypothetical protein